MTSRATNARNSQSQLKVSVLMLVYQHAEFLQEAIESVLAQKCQFEFEFILINDASTDESAKICQQYADLYPQCISFIDNKDNLGMHASFAKLWAASKAEYIAFCEGDDYWIDSKKLEKQVEMLDNNHSVNLVGAKASVIKQNELGEWANVGEIAPPNTQTSYTFNDLISAYHFHFSTVMLRKSSVQFPHWFQSTYCVDRPIYLLACQSGDAGFIDEVVSHYRLHKGGAWSTQSAVKKANSTVSLFTTMADYFDVQYRKRFELTMFEILFSYIAEDMQNKRYRSARNTLSLGLSKLSFKNRILKLRRYFKTWFLLIWKGK
jgi:glycosyltransferase involved in cell wall biosynthesis